MENKSPRPPISADCGHPEGHRDHLCLLMEKGMTDQIAERTSHPAYACKNCKAMANRAEDLCNPVPLKK